jgi:heme-degrading monooxygenase HmoA
VHARVSTFRAGGRLDEAAVEKMRDNVFPRARQIPGNAGVILLADFASGEALSITLWDDEEALRASGQAAAALRQDGAGQIGTQQQGDSAEFRVVGFDVQQEAAR